MKKTSSLYLFVFLFFVLLFLYLLQNKNPDNSSEFTFWASMNFWLFSTPLILYYKNYSNNTSAFSFIGLLGISLLVSYGIPPFQIEAINYQLSPLTIESLKFSFWGYSIFFFTLYLFRFMKKWIKPNNLIKEIDLNKLKLFSLLNALIYISSITFLSAINHLGDYCLFIFLGLSLLFFGRNIKLSLFEKLLFIIILIYEIIIRIVSGLASPVIMLFLYLFIIEYLVNKNIKRIVLPFLFLIVLYVLFSFVKLDYRTEIWENNAQYTTLQKLEILKDLTLEKDNVDKVKEKEKKNDEENFFWRFSYQASAVSLVLNKTPSVIPYWNGETYKIFSKFIPRFLWSNKPVENLGQEFGHSYGILNYNDNSTSMNTPILAEAYMNFGEIGAYLMMILIAILYTYIDIKFNSKDSILVNLILGVSLIFPLIIHESNFSIVFGNIPLKLIVMTCLIKLLNLGK